MAALISKHIVAVTVTSWLFLTFSNTNPFAAIISFSTIAVNFTSDPDGLLILILGQKEIKQKRGTKRIKNVELRNFTHVKLDFRAGAITFVEETGILSSHDQFCSCSHINRFYDCPDFFCFVFRTYVSVVIMCSQYVEMTRISR